MRFDQNKDRYAESWDKAAVIRPAEATKAAARIVAAREQYEHVQKITAVPWFMVGVIHMRESVQDDTFWKTYLGNGQPLNQVTTLVPIGRGPWATWFDGAIDAVTREGIAGFIPENWTIERILYWLERYNGAGYYNMGKPSPYLWAGTNQYTSGKFLEDPGAGKGVYHPEVVDKQLGCAAVLKTLEVQSIITLTRETAVAAPVQSVPVPQPKVSPMPTTPAPIPSGFKFPDLATIEKFVESGDSVLPMVGMIWPPAAMLHAKIIPTLEAVLKIGAKYQTGGDLNAIMPDVAAQLHALAETLAPGSTATAFAALRTPGAVTDRSVGAS